MRLLLDTHTFLWWVTDNGHLENLPIITADPQIHNYTVNIIW